jgi:hypothetical protein
MSLKYYADRLDRMRLVEILIGVAYVHPNEQHSQYNGGHAVCAILGLGMPWKPVDGYSSR